MSGLRAAEVVVLDDHSEKESVYQLSVQTIITEGVMEILMKKENVMSNVVQVRIDTHVYKCSNTETRS